MSLIWGIVEAHQSSAPELRPGVSRPNSDTADKAKKNIEFRFLFAHTSLSTSHIRSYAVLFTITEIINFVISVFRLWDVVQRLLLLTVYCVFCFR